MKWIASLFAAAGLAAALAAPAAAQSMLERVESAGALRIGTEGTYAPFSATGA